jgi:hypothetical protein
VNHERSKGEHHARKARRVRNELFNKESCQNRPEKLANSKNEPHLASEAYQTPIQDQAACSAGWDGIAARCVSTACSPCPCPESRRCCPIRLRCATRTAAQCRWPRDAGDRCRLRIWVNISSQAGWCAHSRSLTVASWSFCEMVPWGMFASSESTCSSWDDREKLEKSEERNGRLTSNLRSSMASVWVIASTTPAWHSLLSDSRNKMAQDKKHTRKE